MFEPSPHLQYMMPAHFGVPHTERTTLAYRDVVSLSVGYRTEREPLEALLPGRLELREPIVSVYYSANRQVDWLAGGGYNLLGVDVPVRFEGEEEQLDGSFCLVLWENDTDAIISGRELLGIPKIYADIEDHQVIQGRWSTRASHRGAAIVDLRIDNAREMDEAAIAALGANAATANWIGWRHVPNIGAPGAAIEHATCVPAGGTPASGLSGEGSIVWHRPTWDENPTQWKIINTLADLPILGYEWALVTRGGTTLADAQKKPLRALR